MGEKAAGPAGYNHLLMAEIWPRIKGLTPNGVLAKPAATLILINRSGKQPKVLMGRRNPNNRFMPGKFVFPGGQLDPEDRIMPAAGALDRHVEDRLGRIRGKSNARAIAMAGIRETFEETGIVLGSSAEGEPVVAPAGGWSDFAAQGQLPNLEAIHFVGRAITPPRLPRRFDTIFLAAEADHITGRNDGFVGPDKELVELAWVPVNDALAMPEVATITGVILRELEDRIASGFSHRLPVPWYGVQHPKGWVRREM
ncbi:MAG: NUDIX domain-containing protein [Beijerinckiaceae bacterium]